MHRRSPARLAGPKAAPSTLSPGPRRQAVHERLNKEMAALRAKAETMETQRNRMESEVANLRAEMRANEAAGRAMPPLRAERDRLAQELRNAQDDQASLRREARAALPTNPPYSSTQQC